MSIDPNAVGRRLESLTPAQRAFLERRLLQRGSEAARRQAIVRRDGDGPCPLSYSQELMWLLSQVFDDGIAYNAPSSFHLRGALELDLLARAFDALVERHEILRTTYSVLDGRPVQVVRSPAPVEINLVDLRALPPAEREGKMQEVLLEESRFAFDLVNGPLLRPTLIRLTEDESVLMLNVHHVATDGYSRTALLRDLTVFYEALAAGVKPELAPLAIQYADYAVWHRNWLDSGVADAQLEYWKRQLSGAPARLDLPTDRPRPPVRSYLGDHMSLMLDTPTREGLRAAARESNATMFVALLALFSTLLGRYAGQEDVVIGTPFAGRNRTELESMVGYFINPLALRIDLSGDPTFSELIARTRDTTQEAFANADVPYEMVVRATNPERDLSQTPVFQAMIVYHNPAYKDDRPKFEPSGVRCTEISHAKGWSKFDVLLGTTERSAGLNTTWEYSTELFNRATLERMTEHFRCLAGSAASGADRPLSRLSMLLESERAKLLSPGNPPEQNPPGDTAQRPSIKALFEAQVRLSPDADAVVGGEARASYAELNLRANKVAGLLRSQGIGPGDIVGVMMEKSIELVAAVLGVVKAGAAFLTLDPAYPPERIEFMLQDARPRLLLIQDAVQVPPTCEAAIVVIDECRAVLEGLPSDDPPTITSDDDLAYVIYTSGSTGVPKGAMITHRGLASVYLAYESEYRLRELAAHAQVASPSFDVFIGDVIRSLLAGAKLVLCPREVVLDPAALYELWAREGVDAVELVPAAAALLFAYAEREGKRLDFMRFIAIGGEGWRSDQYFRFKGLCAPETRLVNSYGLTEGTMDSTYYEPPPDADLASGRFVPIGRPLPNTRVYILDRYLEPQPIGIPGELCIGGEGVARGYLNRPDLTAERFVPDPFSSEPAARMYRTGDLARWLDDGNIEFIGRADRQLKIRGFRIEPGEIESVLEGHPDVRAAAVIDYDEPGGKRLVAYVETPGVIPEAAELRSLVSERVPNYMVPSAFVTLPELPLTPSGKVDRNSLPAPDAHAYATTAYSAPATPLELRLAEIWEELLGVERVGLEDDFFALGGHSLLAVRLVQRIRESLGSNYPLASVFRESTLGAMAAGLNRNAADNATTSPTVLHLQEEGSGPPLFCICGAHVYQELAEAIGADGPVYGILLPVEQELFESGLQGSDRALELTVEELAAAYLDAVREVQPQGPYLLIGYCFGGIVAYEMCHQLDAAGDEVGLLVILDTALRGTFKMRQRKTLRMRAGHLKIRSMRRGARLANSVWPSLNLALGIRPEPDPFQLRMDIYSKAIRRYRKHLRPRGGSALVIQAEDTRNQPTKQLLDETYMWGGLVDDLETTIVPGDHHSHLRSPHVASVADALRPYLRRARSRSRQPAGTV